MRGWTQADIDAYKRKAPMVKPDPVQAPVAAVPSGAAERDLQAKAERFLEARWYVRGTAKNYAKVAQGMYCKGFWYHARMPKGEPDVWPDLTVISWPEQRPPLMIELKTRDIWRPGQKQAVGIGLWRVAWTFDEVAMMVKEWEVRG